MQWLVALQGMPMRSGKAQKSQSSPFIPQLHDQLTSLRVTHSIVKSMMLHAIKLVGQQLLIIGLL